MLPLLRAALPSTTRIELAIRADDAWVLGNETELSQLVLNLCVNASDAFEGRYGTVQVRVEQRDAVEERGHPLRHRPQRFDLQGNVGRPARLPPLLARTRQLRVLVVGAQAVRRGGLQ